MFFLPISLSSQYFDVSSLFLKMFDVQSFTDELTCTSRTINETLYMKIFFVKILWLAIVVIYSNKVDHYLRVFAISLTGIQVHMVCSRCEAGSHAGSPEHKPPSNLELFPGSGNPSRSTNGNTWTQHRDCILVFFAWLY